MTRITGPVGSALDVSAARRGETTPHEDDRPVFRQKDKAPARRPDGPVPESEAGSSRSSGRLPGAPGARQRQHLERIRSLSDHPVRAGIRQFGHNLDITVRDIGMSLGLAVRPAPQEVRMNAVSDHPVRAGLRQLGHDVRVTALDIGLSAREVMAGRGRPYNLPVSALVTGRMAGMPGNRETEPARAAQAASGARPAPAALPQRTSSRLEPGLLVRTRSPAEIQAARTAPLVSQPMRSSWPPVPHRPPPPAPNQQLPSLPDVPDQPAAWVDPAPALPDVPGTSPRVVTMRL